MKRPGLFRRNWFPARRVPESLGNFGVRNDMTTSYMKRLVVKVLWCQESLDGHIRDIIRRDVGNTLVSGSSNEAMFPTKEVVLIHGWIGHEMARHDDCIVGSSGLGNRVVRFSVHLG